MLTYKRRYLNAEEPGADLSTTDTRPEGKAWTWLDNFFGAADTSADIYNKIRMDQVYGPVPPGGYPPPPKKSNTTAYIIGGSVVAGVVLLLIFKK